MDVGWSSLREWLFPREAERDEGFRQEILSLSSRGISIIAGIEVVIAALSFAGFLRWPGGVAILATALGTFLLSRWTPAYEHSRWIAAASTGIAAAFAAREIGHGVSEDFAVGATAVLLLGSVVVPLLPVQSMVIGAIAVIGGVEGKHTGFLTMMAIAGTAVASTVYAQRRAAYLSYISVIRASQDLQSRLLISESSNTMTRMSAALAHELSNPLGAASSSISTLLLVAGRMAHATPEDQKRLVVLQSELARSLNDSMGRLKRIVNRIQRLTVLDEATTRSADINELIHEAIEIIRPDAPAQVQFELDLQPIPDITCRPQQLIDVFANILTNSLQALGGRGRIAVATSLVDSRIEVLIRDNGHGISKERLAHIFDPAFQAADGRISTGNWTLFTSRQFVKDHGGEMHIQSREGTGTTVSVTLPC